MRKAARAIVLKDNALLVMHRNKFGEQYYTLVGGGVSWGETPEQTVVREIMEETSLQIANPRLVFVEQAGVPYGDQYIFVCDYVSGEIRLHPDTDEAKINELGANIYTPMWLPLKDLPGVPFLSETLKTMMLKCFAHGFPNQPQLISPHQGVHV